MSLAHPSRRRGLAVVAAVLALSGLGTWSAGAAECGLLGLMSCSDSTTTTSPPPPNGPPPAGEAPAGGGPFGG
ncbi:MAG TPA: hypothetical protein VNT56_08935, partial [Acidimicrobiales bacterium]|nr:hypothetical protein [Acidimicrobiales bacterium]